MSNPYLITEPACISFSGGRSSGYMLYQILQAHGGTLPDYIKVVFANTGKEMPQTLDFVRDCSEQWGVPITWVEYRSKNKTAIVDHATASRDGEPFAALIADKRYLPNPIARFCTSELKVSRIADVADGVSVIGIRSDEPRRVAKMRARDDVIVPLADAGVRVDDVLRFWQAQAFDLAISSSLSNCDLCMLKSMRIKTSTIRDVPGCADWWAEQERTLSETLGKPARFRSDQPDYATLRDRVANQDTLSFIDESISCYCGD